MANATYVMFIIRLQRFYGDSSDTLYTGGTDHRAYFEACYINGS